MICNIISWLFGIVLGFYIKKIFARPKLLRCKECGWYSNVFTPYCPFCGIKDNWNIEVK